MNFTPEEDYKGLLIQARALQSLVNSYEKRIANYAEKDYTLSEERIKNLTEQLESEKEMNANLTEELNRYEGVAAWLS